MNKLPYPNPKPTPKPKKPKNGEMTIMPVPMPGVIGPEIPSGRPKNPGRGKGNGYKPIKMYPTPVTKKRKK